MCSCVDPPLPADGAHCHASDAGQAPRADAPNTRADSGSPAELPGDQLFGQPEILHFRFTLDETRWRELEEHGNAEQYVEASLEFESTRLGAHEFPSLGLRHKGAWTLHHCWDEFGGTRSYANECAKLSLKVKFDRHDPLARLDGLKRINLHAMQTDPVKMRELLAYRAFLEFGVPAPRVLPARVTVNGALLGLFMAVEDVDGRFTRTHFPRSADGNLYKETWPHVDLDETSHLDALKTNEEAGDVSGMLAFAQAVGRATPESFAATVGAHLDVAHTLRYLAVDRALNNWDGVMAFYQPEKPHNFYWYHDQGDSNLFRLVPWDLDNTMNQDWFTDPPDAFGVAALPDWNQKPHNCDPRPVWDPNGPVRVTPPRCDQLLNLLATVYWREFVQLGNQLLEGAFDTCRLQSRADAWMQMLDPLIAEDPLLDVAQWRDTSTHWRERVLPQLAREFRSFLEQGLIDEPTASAP